MPCADTDMLPRYDTSLLGPWARKLPARPVTVPVPEQGELDEVAAVERQLGHLLGVDQLTERRIAALQLHRSPPGSVTVTSVVTPAMVER